MHGSPDIKGRVPNLKNMKGFFKRENDSIYLRMDVHTHDKIITENETVSESLNRVYLGEEW